MLILWQTSLQETYQLSTTAVKLTRYPALFSISGQIIIGRRIVILPLSDFADGYFCTRDGRYV